MKLRKLLGKAYLLMFGSTATLFWLSQASAITGEVKVLSPDRQIAFTLSENDGHLKYDVTFKDQIVIGPSPLRISLDGEDLCSGVELGKLQARALHNTTLPFTRLLAGHADYTPVHFGPRRGDTTWTHQIASAAILTSPLLTYGAHPTNLLNNPAVGMIKSIPSVWDETIVLPPSEIGELAAFARRSGDVWFLAVLNGPEPRKLNIPLGFLGDGDYGTAMVTDNKDNPASVKTVDTTVVRGGSLGIDLRKGGGFIARFSRK